jgi:hypothetical protein
MEGGCSCATGRDELAEMSGLSGKASSLNQAPVPSTKLRTLLSYRQSESLSPAPIKPPFAASIKSPPPRLPSETQLLPAAA